PSTRLPSPTDYIPSAPQFYRHPASSLLSPFLQRRPAHLLPHPFPTRRSSDLLALPLLHHAPRPGRRGLRDLARHADERDREVLRSEEQRLNSSHDQISYAVFCLKKKKNKIRTITNSSLNPSKTIARVSPSLFI